MNKELQENVASEHDVRLQLKKMVESRCFRKKYVRVLFLKYLVEMALDSQPVNEDSIGKALVPGYKKDSDDDVRVHITNLRKTLNEYYATEGAQDLVLIELDRGEGYRPKFSYMPDSKVIISYKLGLHHTRTLNEHNIRYGMERLKSAELDKPDFAPAYAARAIAMLLYKVLYNAVRLVPNELMPDFENVRSLAERAIKIDPKQWLAYIALGGHHCCHWQWQEARTCFEKAVELNEPESSMNGWYAAFLLAMGFKERALGIVTANAKPKPEDLNAQLTCGLFLYAAREHERAEHYLSRATILTDNHWAPTFISGLNDLAKNDPASAGYNFREASEYVRFDDALFPGFTMLSDVREGDFEQAGWSYSLSMDNVHHRPIDTIMAHMASEKFDEAVAELERACADHDPVMCWLHLWPVFDPLRQHPRFKRIIASMNLPDNPPKG